MKRHMIGVFVVAWLAMSPMAEAGVGGLLAGVWNVIPGALNVVNKGVHFVMDPILTTVHSAIHGLAEGLTVDLTPSEPAPHQ